MDVKAPEGKYTVGSAEIIWKKEEGADEESEFVSLAG